ncbi:MAG: hydrogenase [Proteobacteria bacterium]|nr:hydrogenase [Pseudomonadota bacterium]
MTQLVDIILSLSLLSIIFSFGSSRLQGLIKALAFQGIVVSIVPFFMGHELSGGDIVFSLTTLLIRGIGIPLYLYSAIEKIAVHRELEPIIGYHGSILIGLLMVVAAMFVSRKINVPSASDSLLLLPTAMVLLSGGMFLMMARRKAITMVLGYMTMENGIYLVGTTFSVRAHHIVEFGVLLDVLAGVMIMAVILQNMKQGAEDPDMALNKISKE